MTPAAMRSPAEIAGKLARRWQRSAARQRYLLEADAWPMVEKIGQPSPRQFAQQPLLIREHIKAWQQISEHENIGEVIWQERRFRQADAPVALPQEWRIRRPSEWAAACAVADSATSAAVQEDYGLLSSLIEAADEVFHELLIAQLPRLRGKPEEELRRAVKIATQLSPGVARGKPLRALNLARPVSGKDPQSHDSKFFERHRSLIIRLLDERFEGAASAQGLEAFLGAASEADHWLLVVPLSKGLLPFKQQRVRASELAECGIRARNILIVENERCVHLLPELEDTVAILGAGLNLSWMAADWLADKRVGYWGDMDTWGLAMLGMARDHQRHLTELLMDQASFDSHRHFAVEEPVAWGSECPPGLLDHECELYLHLLNTAKGRLEQEFLTENDVADELRRWWCNASG